MRDTNGRRSVQRGGTGVLVRTRLEHTHTHSTAAMLYGTFGSVAARCWELRVSPRV